MACEFCGTCYRELDLQGFDLCQFNSNDSGALVLTLAQLTIKPILTLLTLPINILTLGLFSLVINGLIIWLMASIVPGIYLKSFGAAIIAWILVSIVGLFVRPLIL